MNRLAVERFLLDHPESSCFTLDGDELVHQDMSEDIGINVPLIWNPSGEEWA